MNDKLIAYTADKTISARNYIANKAAERNLDKAKKIAGFNELFIRKKELEISVAKLPQNSAERKLSENELSSVTEKLEEILQKNGLSGKDIKPKYYCKKCGDTGFIDGKVCKCKLELIAKLRERALGESGNDVPTIYEVTSPLKDEQQEKRYFILKDKLQKLCDVFPKSDLRSLVFIGKSGTGKTFLAKSIANTLEQKGFDVMTLSAFSLNNLFLKYHTSFDDSLAETFSYACNCDVLVIDDLGTEPIYRNVTKEYFTNILNERNAFGKMTIVTTNLSPDAIADTYDQRLASRLFDKNTSRTIPFDFDDLRKKI